MKEITKEKLRIIDANINRLGEGLRVLEEFARMAFNDSVLTQKLKEMRHKAVKIDTSLQKRLLGARDSAGDVGSDMEVTGDVKKRNITHIISANAKRAQESLRVLEEIAKNPDNKLETERFRKARFELYEIEKELMGKASRKEKIERITGLYAVIDTEWLKGRKPDKIAEQMIKGGARIIQLRCKERGIGAFLDIAKDLQQICARKNVLFIINDSLEVALAVSADGLHIGQEDIPVTEARKLIPIDMILGCSVTNLKQAIKAKKDGADYLGVGAIYATETKTSSKPMGVGAIREIKKATGLPIVAIGGINKSNLDDVIKAGADSAAVISGIMGVDNIEKATREMVQIIKEIKK
jgi:thiamine-phosphate pyrophosphorylase